jgi:hypothetical protein
VSRSRYRADNGRSGMGGFILADARLQTAMLVVAQDGQAHAEEIAPYKTGDYLDHFDVSDESGRTDSVGATLFNDSDHAALVEYELTGTLGQTADYLNAKMRRRG